MDRIKASKIGVVSIPMVKANEIPFSNFINVLTHFTENLVVVATYGDSINIKKWVKGKPKIYEIIHHSKKKKLLNIFQYIKLQFTISFYILISRKHVDTWIFYDGERLIIPIIITKVIQKKIILLFGRSISKESESQGVSIQKLVQLIGKISVNIVDYIILYSPILISKWNLENYKNKVLIAHKHYINFDAFYVSQDYGLRSNYIGYVGRFIELKGILNFVKSINQVVSINKTIKILIAGDGVLKAQVESYLTEHNLNEYVVLVGWISRKDLPLFLNQLKLLVIPSYTEGLPNIMLESMACGTPVLAAPVGAITDIIINEKNGFLMENNSSSCIAKNIIYALDNPNIESISKEATNYIRSNYSYNEAVESYKKIFQNILVCK